MEFRRVLFRSMALIRGAIDGIPHERYAVTLKFGFKAQPELLHDPPRSNIRRFRNRDQAVQPNAFEGVAQRRTCGLGCQASAPTVTRQPPTDLRLQLIAPRAGAAEADHLSGRLLDQLPAAIAALGVELDLTIDEAPDLFVGPRYAAGDVAHHFGIPPGQEGTTHIRALHPADDGG